MGFCIENGILRKFIPSDAADIIIPEGVSCIGKRVFEFCRYLRSVKISESVTSIEECAFLDCNNLTTMEIPNSVPILFQT
ncbi:MAG: leucine-rich repeat domain-containing protein [Oscillospiraceae bacterium]|nr:leucine-rich repeat domain-containing protein [Oscillospiraceae bacterium]